MFKKGDIVTGIPGSNYEFGVFTIARDNYPAVYIECICETSDCWELFKVGGRYNLSTKQLKLVSSKEVKENKSSLDFIFSISK